MFGMGPQQSALSAAMARPSLQNPGGGPQVNVTDPLKPDFQVVVLGLQRFAARAKQIGDEQLGNELDAMANRLTRRQLKRQNAFDNANKQGATAQAIV